MNMSIIYLQKYNKYYYLILCILPYSAIICQCNKINHKKDGLSGLRIGDFIDNFQKLFFGCLVGISLA